MANGPANPRNTRSPTSRYGVYRGGLSEGHSLGRLCHTEGGSGKRPATRETDGVVAVVAFSWLARIWGKCSTIYSPPTLFFFFF